ncbi:MAG TPA: hypothetical protein IAA06_01130 [Candidatus Blautia faecavium]|uniref:V-type ATP synthase subunit I n=1 Tax=Candidatus Blautia faecavium TaxID=2838487 RepID=A0A9D2LPU1_9FIRM|nr:hypothetical protein [Candidatus Blautia faecavium]
MIVPMKKVSLIVLNDEKKNALKKLRKLGLLHIEIKEGKGPRLLELKEQIASLEKGLFAVADLGAKDTVQKEADTQEALSIAERIDSLKEEQKKCYGDISAYEAELERVKSWGEIDPEEIAVLAEKGIVLSLHEMIPSEYEKLGDSAKTIVLERTKDIVRFLFLHEEIIQEAIPEEEKVSLERSQLKLPSISTGEIRRKLKESGQRLQSLKEELAGLAAYRSSLEQAIMGLKKEVEFETYASGMGEEDLSEDSSSRVSVAYLVGFLPAEDLSKLLTMARENAWGLLAEDPTEEDDAPTKLKNNKFVSLVYPLTDFLGSVPGYFEPDISGWFLVFIMIFVGIIFGDGGYGLLICGISAAMMLKNHREKKAIAPITWLLLLFGGITVVWGTVTCSWFGLAPEVLPQWLRKLSVPVLSNVYSDKVWYPFWTGGEAGLTTSQNVQIFCFTIALVHLLIAHVSGARRNRGSLKMLGDIGSILELIGMYYVVLSMVVNGAVFGLDLVVSGIPVGTIAIALVIIGFVVNFIFGNYEKSILQSVLDSVKDIVSMLLGVVNVFSDIVSYIRLWAVGLAGAAISSTVNEMVNPLLGHFIFIIFAVVVLVFGHGLNMILNVLSVIVHGIRLNTLEFSTHIGLSWSGHKYKPFEE